MNVKFSVSKSVRLLIVLAGLALAAIAGQSVLAKSDDHMQKASQPEIVHASRIEQVSKGLTVQEVESRLSEKITSLTSQSKVKSEIQPGDDKGQLEPQPTDDKGGLNPSQDKSNPEPGDDKSQHELQPGDDKGMDEINDDGPNHDMEEQDGDDIEFVGVLSAINGDTLTINGRTVVITPMTEVKGTLMVGETVKVEGILQSDNSVQAREIKAATETQNDHQEQEKTPAPTLAGDDHGVDATPAPASSRNLGGRSNSGGSDDRGPDNRGGGHHDDGSNHH